MGCSTMNFTDLGDLTGTSFPTVSDMQEEHLCLESEITSEQCFEGIIGKSSAIQRVLEQVSIVAPTDSTVLLHGETGTAHDQYQQYSIERGLWRQLHSEL